MIRKINQFNTKVLYEKTQPCLPKAANPLTGAMDSKDPECLWPDKVRQLSIDLVETAESIADHCLGLAATQIWDYKDGPCPRMFVMRWPQNPDDPNKKSRGWDWQVIINPIVKTTGKTIKYEEGCLSLPGHTFTKSRGKNVIMTFQVMGNTKPVTLKFFGKESIVPYIIQHEVDHLDGKLISNKYKQKRG